MQKIETNYEKSNKIETVKLNSFDKTYYKKLLSCGDDVKVRNILAQSLVDYLCKKFNVMSVPIQVKNTYQPHRTNGNGKMTNKTLGRYWHCGSRPIKIEIWNKTAIKQQVISNKVFIDTLLHEFIHHYDTVVLGLDTIHSAGFYKRISDLTNKLK